MPLRLLTYSLEYRPPPLPPFIRAPRPSPHVWTVSSSCSLLWSLEYRTPASPHLSATIPSLPSLEHHSPLPFPSRLHGLLQLLIALVKATL